VAVLEQKAAGPRGPIPVERSSTESATEQPPALESATARAGLSPNAGSGGRGEFAAHNNWLALAWLAGAAIMNGADRLVSRGGGKVRRTGRTVTSGAMFQLVEGRAVNWRGAADSVGGSRSGSVRQP